MTNALGLDVAAVGNHHFDVNYRWFIDLLRGLLAHDHVAQVKEHRPQSHGW